MKIDEMIAALFALKNKVGGDAEVPMVTTVGENDYIQVSYPIVGDFEDQDGNTFKCAFIGDCGGEEFTEKGIPHYEWTPSKNKVDYSDFTGFSNDSLRFDGYVHMSEEDLKRMPEPTIVDESEICHVRLNGCWWEDARVNGVIDEKAHEEQMPGYKGGNINWDIDINSGIIMNWNNGTEAKVWYKIVDEFCYDYKDYHYGPDYVPSFMAIDGDGWGDYVKITIEKDGKIKNWSKDKFLKCLKYDIENDKV